MKITSLGTVVGNPDAKRSLELTLAIPSFAKYAVITNSSLRVGTGTEIFGLVQANGGVHFDGIAHNLVTSAAATYKDPDHSGNDEFGVHTHTDPVDPVPPATVPPRPDVFQTGRQFPVAVVNFDTLADSMVNLKSLAQTDGFYIGSSIKNGYHIVLKTNGTFDLYRVDTLVPVPNNCPSQPSQTGWGTWSIQGETLLSTTPFPHNGLIFIEDDIWVDGQINNAHLTIAVGRFPENQGQGKSITINNNLLYTKYDGSDSIGLIGQLNVNVGLVSMDTLRIDAALIAKSGRVGRYYYKPPDSQPRCTPYHTRSALSLYGMLASNARYGFSYADNTGYQTRNIIYDANMLYAPPPSFPLVDDEYSILSWRETHN